MRWARLRRNMALHAPLKNDPGAKSLLERMKISSGSRSSGGRKRSDKRSKSSQAKKEENSDEDDDELMAVDCVKKEEKEEDSEPLDSLNNSSISKFNDGMSQQVTSLVEIFDGRRSMSWGEVGQFPLRDPELEGRSGGDFESGYDENFALDPQLSGFCCPINDTPLNTFPPIHLESNGTEYDKRIDPSNSKTCDIVRDALQTTTTVEYNGFHQPFEAHAPAERAISPKTTTVVTGTTIDITGNTVSENSQCADTSDTHCPAAIMIAETTDDAHAAIEMDASIAADTVDYSPMDYNVAADTEESITSTVDVNTERVSPRIKELGTEVDVYLEENAAGPKKDTPRLEDTVDGNSYAPKELSTKALPQFDTSSVLEAAEQSIPIESAPESEKLTKESTKEPEPCAETPSVIENPFGTTPKSSKETTPAASARVPPRLDRTSPGFTPINKAIGPDPPSITSTSNTDPTFSIVDPGENDTIVVKMIPKLRWDLRPVSKMVSSSNSRPKKKNSKQLPAAKVPERTLRTLRTRPKSVPEKFMVPAKRKRSGAQHDLETEDDDDDGDEASADEDDGEFEP
ncbi:hypothetical protein EDC01DRAFT_359303 [Geopyxis carbonaria]|nr:hypothetical protein EDC01DRAFT_359303 [Geopyxis carbonaria]